MTAGEKTNGEPSLDSVRSLQRKLAELSTLYEISKAVGASLDLEQVTERVLRILHEMMGMERGTLTLLDSRTNELFVEVAHGLDPDTARSVRYRLGEGITGKVVAAGEPIVVPNVGNEPLFLNRRGGRGDITRAQIAFICVPIFLDKKTIGALSVDRLFSENVSFEEDVRLLTIIASMISQAVRIHQMVEAEREKLRRENRELKRELKKKFKPSNIVGDSKRMEDVYASIELVAQTRATVMLRGESGTGKELVAHAIHYTSERSDGPFVKVSCAALPDTLLESELFGFEKGAFTGAAVSKKGRFEMANGGTLFLDEIGEIPASTQVKLLRVLQEREFERLGGTETIRVDIRLITATNRDLEKEVREGRFREDLYYRLNVVPIFLPALRERRDDIPLLVRHFLAKSSEENGKPVDGISDEAMDHLARYGWPGNVRELQNAVERAVVLCQGGMLGLEHFPMTGTPGAPAQGLYSAPRIYSELEDVQESINSSLPDAVSRVEKKMIQEALDQVGGNQRRAARILGLTERQLGYKVKRYGLK